MRSTFSGPPRPLHFYRLVVCGAAFLVVTACGAGRTAGPAASAAGPQQPVVSAPSGVPATSRSPATTPPEPAPPSPAGPAGLPSSEHSAQPLTLPVSAPVSVSVPAIGVDSTLVELGRHPDGTVEVPSLDDPDAKPGWYRDSPTPGALGPAIILGHIDSRRFGPGVFYDLKDLRPGDGINVTRADGSVAHFRVDSVRAVAKSDFPTLEVYGNLDHAGLRLITCGGEFDPDAAGYESNIIVFASLVGAD